MSRLSAWSPFEHLDMNGDTVRYGRYGLSLNNNTITQQNDDDGDGGDDHGDDDD